MRRTAHALRVALALAWILGICSCGAEPPRSQRSSSAGKPEPLGNTGLTGTILEVRRSREGTRFQVRFHNAGNRGKNVYLVGMTTPEGAQVPHHSSIARVISCYPTWVEAGRSATGNFTVSYAGDGPISIGQYVVTDSTFADCKDLSDYVAGHGHP